MPGVYEKREPPDVRRGFWREYGRMALIALSAALFIRYFIAQPFVVNGSSMEPNFEGGEYLVVDELSYFFRDPLRGEPIVFKYPLNPSKYFVKRIIGLPSERVEIKGGRVTIYNSLHPNGFTLEESYLAPRDRASYPDGAFSLSANEYFVMGDNRDESSDSRFWGPLERRFITGRTFFRLWPLRRMGDVTANAPSFISFFRAYG